MRFALSNLVPKTFSTSTRGDGSLPIARLVCRLIAPDHIFQHFRRDSNPAAKLKKKIFSQLYPTVYGIIISVISKKCGKDFEKAVSAFGRHLVKCSDRKRSKQMFRDIASNQPSQDADTEELLSSDNET